MRLMARILIESKKTNDKIDSLDTLLLPDNFDAIVNSIKVISRKSNAPSIVKKTRYTLLKCLTLMKGKCIRKRDLETKALYDGTSELVCNEWHTLLAAKASKTLQKRQCQKEESLPLTTDLIKLTNFVNEKIQQLKQKLQESENANDWLEFAKYCLASIILFNRKRTGESSRIILQDFIKSIEKKTPLNEETLKTLSKQERDLASRMRLIKVEGKRGNVPVLLTQSMEKNIQFLVKMRMEKNINKSNKYLFPSTLISTKEMRGTEILRKITMKAGLANPSAITGTKLRKYMATTLQILNLAEHELDWVARHLGHDIHVHRRFYRQQEDAVELSKIAKLLLAQEKGLIHKFAGKNLDEIDIEDEIMNEDENEEEKEVEKQKPVKQLSNVFFVSPSVGKKKGRIIGTVRDIASPSVPVAKRGQRRKWQEKELAAINNYFQKKISEGVRVNHWKCLPSKEEAIMFLKKHKLDRTWTEVKDQVRNTIQRHRIMKGR
ncbi:hypothetical protein WDU94_014007 [Cyamophila willieti]